MGPIPLIALSGTATGVMVARLVLTRYDQKPRPVERENTWWIRLAEPHTPRKVSPICWYAWKRYTHELAFTQPTSESQPYGKHAA